MKTSVCCIVGMEGEEVLGGERMGRSIGRGDGGGVKRKQNKK